MRHSRSSSLHVVLGALLTALLAVGFLAPAASAATVRTLSIKSGSTGTLAKGSVTFSGVLSGSPKGSKVTVQRKSGKTWVAAKTTTTKSAAGGWSVRVPMPSQVGVYSFRAVAAKTGALKAATSAVVKVAAQRRPKVTIKASPTTVNAGTKSTFSGTVKPFVKNGGVTIQRLNGQKWVTAGTATVTSKGTYSTPVVVNVSAVFRTVSARIGLNAPGTSLNAVVITNPIIATSSLPTAFVGGNYSARLRSVGDIDGTWTAAPLPAGLSVNAKSGVISGTPTAAGSTEITLGFKQSISNQKAPSKKVTLQVTQPIKPVITTASLPPGTVGQAYTTTLTATASGDAATGTWSASALPPGLALDAGTGVISGTPTAGGTTSVTLNFTQGGNPIDANAKTLLLKVAVPPPPTITTSSLPDGVIGQVYSTTLSASGATGTWSASPLPGGLALSASTGVISGTPTTAATTAVTINFTESGNPTPANPVTLNLKVARPVPVIVTASLPDGRPLTDYSAQLKVSGNVAGTWKVTGLNGTGLSVNATTGVISGRVTSLPRTIHITVNFTDGFNAAAPKNLTIRIANTG